MEIDRELEGGGVRWRKKGVRKIWGRIKGDMGEEVEETVFRKKDHERSTQRGEKYTGKLGTLFF